MLVGLLWAPWYALPYVQQRRHARVRRRLIQATLLSAVTAVWKSSPAGVNGQQGTGLNQSLRLWVRFLQRHHSSSVAARLLRGCLWQVSRPVGGGVRGFAS
jgi:hypothetical protein